MVGVTILINIVSLDPEDVYFSAKQSDNGRFAENRNTLNNMNGENNNRLIELLGVT